MADAIPYEQIIERIKDDVDWIAENAYARGYNTAKMEIALSGEYERAYQRGKTDAQQWIPCSVKLPEEYGEYRITWTTSASKKRFIGDSEFEVTSEWDAERYRFKGEWLLDEYTKNYPDVKVIAWKPIGEPWEGEQHDGKL